MPKYGISLEKESKLESEMARLKIKEDDLLEKFIQGSGSGGQKINKTSSTVYIKHSPSGIEVKCQKTRSQSLNRYYARKELCEKIAEKVLNIKTKRKYEIEKLKRQKRKRSKRAKAKMLDNKKKRSIKKDTRKKVKDER